MYLWQHNIPTVYYSDRAQQNYKHEKNAPVNPLSTVQKQDLLR